MLPITINNQEYNLPSKWEEVSWKQYIAMTDQSKKVEELRLLSALSGLDYSTIVNAEVKGFDTVLASMQFTKLDITQLEKPKTITIKGVECELPEDIKAAGSVPFAFGKAMLLRAKIRECTEAGEDPLVLIPYAVATYFQPEVTKTKLDDNAVKHIEKEIQSMPVMQVYPTGNFFLTSLRLYSN